jgi:DNA-directed RNA polymerase subunit omega
MDITSLPVEYDREGVGSKYRLVVIAAQRARELALGASPRLKTKANKVTTTALLEVLSGDIPFLTGDEAAVAREKAEKIDYKKLMEGKRAPIADLSELEKDLKVYLHERETNERALEELFSEGDEGE